MLKLENDIMREYLRLGLVKVYSENIVLDDGTFDTLIKESVEEKSYEIQLICDSRYEESPFVRVLMMEGEPMVGFSNWEYYLAKEVDMTLLDIKG